jgi:adenine-specific DNA-methyltransferase
MPEIVFKGKEFVYNHPLTVPYRLLMVHAEKGVGAPLPMAFDCES